MHLSREWTKRGSRLKFNERLDGTRHESFRTSRSEDMNLRELSFSFSPGVSLKPQMKVQFFSIKHSLVSNSSVIYCGRLKCTKSTLLPSNGNSCRLRWRLVCFANGFRAVSVLLPHSNVFSRTSSLRFKIWCLSSGGRYFQRWYGQQSPALCWRGPVFELERWSWLPSRTKETRNHYLLCMQFRLRQPRSWEACVCIWERLYILYNLAHFTGVRKTGRCTGTQVYIANQVYINSGPSCVCRQIFLPAHHSIWDCCLSYFGFGSCYELVWTIFQVFF